MIKGTNPNIRLDFFNTMVQTYGLLLSNFFHKFLLKKCGGGVCEMAQFLQALAAHPKGPSLISRIHTEEFQAAVL